jgi:integral membrane protein (TIGR01906 family)
MKRFAYIIFTIIFFIFAFLMTFSYVVFDLDFYESKFEKYSISKSSNIANDNLMNITNDLLKYLKDEKSDLNYKHFYSSRELAHLKDVRALFQKGFAIRNTSFFALLILFFYLLKSDRKLIRKGFMLSSIFSLYLIALLFVISLIDFNKCFTYFHLIFFNNDLWILDENDILIQMFPEKFFMSIFIRILLLFVSIMSIILITTKSISKCSQNPEEYK